MKNRDENQAKVKGKGVVSVSTALGTKLIAHVPFLTQLILDLQD